MFRLTIKHANTRIYSVPAPSPAVRKTLDSGLNMYPLRINLSYWMFRPKLPQTYTQLCLAYLHKDALIRQPTHSLKHSIMHLLFTLLLAREIKSLQGFTGPHQTPPASPEQPQPQPQPRCRRRRRHCQPLRPRPPQCQLMGFLQQMPPTPASARLAQPLHTGSRSGQEPAANTHGVGKKGGTVHPKHCWTHHYSGSRARTRRSRRLAVAGRLLFAHQRTLWPGACANHALNVNHRQKAKRDHATSDAQFDGRWQRQSHTGAAQLVAHRGCGERKKSTTTTKRVSRAHVAHTRTRRNGTAPPDWCIPCGTRGHGTPSRTTGSRPSRSGPRGT